MVIGHEKQIKLLKGFLKNNLFFSSFLFWGPEKLGKKIVAQEFIKGLLCQNNHWGGCGADSDVLNLSRSQACSYCQDTVRRDYLLIDENFLPNRIIDCQDDKPYGINTSRAIIKFLSTTPAISRRKIVLINNAHLLTQEAQNSLLKIIEEPPVHAVIILVTDKPNRLYETILSRTLQIGFSLVKQLEIIKWKELLKSSDEIARFSLGRPGLAFEFSQNKELLAKFKKTVLSFLSFETKTVGEKVVLSKKFLESSLDLNRDLELWQGILRDELLSYFELDDLSLILSKKRIGQKENILTALKSLRVLSEAAENFPATAEAVFKRVALSV